MTAFRLGAGLGLAALVAACGANGPPVPPGPSATAPHVVFDNAGTKVTVTGEARIGVAVRN